MHSNRQKFYTTLKEFGTTTIAFGLIIGLIYGFGGFYKKTSKGFTCPAEQIVQVDGKKGFKGSGGHFFRGGHLQSSDYAHTGKFSIKLNKDDPYGFNYIIPVADGDELITASVWRYAPNQSKSPGSLACKAGSFYQETAKVVERTEEGWEKLSLRLDFPVDVRNEEINIYCYNLTATPIYFDNLSIQMNRVAKD